MSDSLLEKPVILKKAAPVEDAKAKLALNTRALSIIIPIAIFLVALLPRILHLDTFLTADEDDQIMFATHFLKSVLRGDFSGSLVLGYPGVPTLILGGLGVGLRYLFHYSGLYPLAWVTADFQSTLDQVTARFGIFDHPLDFILWVRVPMVLAAALSIVGIYLLAKRLAGEPVAVLCALLLAFDPFILAHSRVIHVDAPLSYFMFLSFLAFLLYLDKGQWRWLLLSGMFGGLAGLSKTPAGLLGPILVVSGIIYALLPPPTQPRSLRWKRLAVALVVWGLIAIIAVFALWPSMWSRPLFAINHLIVNLKSVNNGAHPTTGIFWGGLQTDKNPLYYLIVFPFHLTPLNSFGILAGLAMLGAGAVARWRPRLPVQPNQMQLAHHRWLVNILPLALSLIAYTVIFIAPVSNISRRGDRYILPVFFAVALFVALALWWLAKSITLAMPHLMRRLHLSAARLAGFCIALQIIAVLAHHPYYLAYFNPLLAGASTAPQRINVGWGEGLDQAAAYLNKIPGDKKPQVAAWYSNQFAPYYAGPTIDLSNQEAALTADYTVFYINQVQRGFPSREILNYFRQRTPEHVVRLGGIEYAWIYKGPVIGQAPQDDFNIPIEAVIAGGARLYGVQVGKTVITADEYAAPADNVWEGPYMGYEEKFVGLPVTLFWETVGSIQTNHGKVNAYIRLVDENGNIWGTIDRLILAGLWRVNRWRPGYYLRDEYKLPIDPATPPGRYHLEIGLYDFESGDTFGVVNNVGEITLTPPKQLPDPDTIPLDVASSLIVNEELKVLGHTYADNQLPPGAEITGKIFWQATDTIDGEYNVSFSFLSDDQKQYIINEQPLLSTYPTSKWRKSEILGAAYRFRVPAVAPPGQYVIQATVLDAVSGEAAGAPIPISTITVEELERNFELPEHVIPISAIINNEIELVGYRLEDETLRRRETFGLTLYWRSLDFADANYSVFVHAAGPDQSIRGQWDSVPVQGTSPTGGWLPGEIIEDHYDVPMGRDVPLWKYDIFVGMYNPVTGQRLPVYSTKAPTSENRVWLTRLPAIE